MLDISTLIESVMDCAEILFPVFAVMLTLGAVLGAICIGERRIK